MAAHEMDAGASTITCEASDHRGRSCPGVSARLRHPSAGHRLGGPADPTGGAHAVPLRSGFDGMQAQYEHSAADEFVSR
jgi:hypothetical protein